MVSLTILESKNKLSTIDYFLKNINKISFKILGVRFKFYPQGDSDHHHCEAVREKDNWIHHLDSLEMDSLILEIDSLVHLVDILGMDSENLHHHYTYCNGHKLGSLCSEYFYKESPGTKHTFLIHSLQIRVWFFYIYWHILGFFQFI